MQYMKYVKLHPIKSTLNLSQSARVREGILMGIGIHGLHGLQVDEPGRPRRSPVKLCRYMRGVYVTAFDTAKVSRSPLKHRF